MEFINRITHSTNTEQLINDLTQGLEGSFDLGIIFVCPIKPYDPVYIYEEIGTRLKVRHLLVCTVAGVVGTKIEIEGQPAASLMLARLPGVSVDSFYINQAQLERMQTVNDWYEFLDIYPNEEPVFLVFPDPFSIDAHRLIDAFNEAYKGSAVLGGLLSAGSSLGENSLIIDDAAYKDGAIGVCLRGNIMAQTIVSQGCRPIGANYIVTKAKQNVVLELGGRPFLEVLQEILDQLPEQDRQLAKEAVLVGIVRNEYKETFERGDFLIRGLLGVDEETGAGVIGDVINVGQTIQFQVRDAHTATEDMHELLKLFTLQKGWLQPEGALVFTCNGRGFNLFKEKNHDINLIQHYVGPIEAAGFFCAGEIGPVTGINYIHGFTNSTILFYPKQS